MLNTWKEKMGAFLMESGEKLARVARRRVVLEPGGLLPCSSAESLLNSACGFRRRALRGCAFLAKQKEAPCCVL